MRPTVEGDEGTGNVSLYLGCKEGLGRAGRARQNKRLEVTNSLLQSEVWKSEVLYS